MLDDLCGKKALITGGNTGIGEKASLILAKYGVDICFTYFKNKIQAQEVKTQIQDMGRSCLSFQIDLAHFDRIGNLWNKIISNFGNIDIVVNNASSIPFSNILQTKVEEWNRVLAVNLTAVFYLSQLAINNMIRHNIAGSIINIGSIVSNNAVKNMTAYSVSKGGIETLTKQLALELSGTGIRINCISPGIISTVNQLERMSPLEKQNLPKYIPLGRFGNPEEIANLILFLASKAASYINGSIIAADGGLSVREAG